LGRLLKAATAPVAHLNAGNDALIRLRKVGLDDVVGGDGARLQGRERPRDVGRELGTARITSAKPRVEEADLSPETVTRLIKNHSTPLFAWMADTTEDHGCCSGWVNTAPLICWKPDPASARGWMRNMDVSVPFRYSAGNRHPDHDTIAPFRATFLPDLKGLFVQVLLLAQEAGVLTLGTISLDGTKIHADASKSKAVSDKRSGEREAHLRAEVEELFALAEQMDERDRPDGLVVRDEIARREDHLAPRAAAKTVIEERARTGRPGAGDVRGESGAAGGAGAHDGSPPGRTGAHAARARSPCQRSGQLHGPGRAHHEESDRSGL